MSDLNDIKMSLAKLHARLDIVEKYYTLQRENEILRKENKELHQLLDVDLKEIKLKVKSARKKGFTKLFPLDPKNKLTGM